jgi:hypothetical protein
MDFMLSVCVIASQLIKPSHFFASLWGGTVSVDCIFMIMIESKENIHSYFIFMRMIESKENIHSYFAVSKSPLILASLTTNLQII